MAKRSVYLRQAMMSCARSASPPTSKPAATTPAETRRRHFRPGGEGKQNITGYFPPEVKKHLRLLAADQGTTIQNLLAEALNDLFAKKGKPLVSGPRTGTPVPSPQDWL